MSPDAAFIAGEPTRVVCVAGPTGAGKTALAIKLAKKLDGEIINADSRQVYAAFPIVTAQPEAEERAEVPHHLYGFLGAAEKISAGKWLEYAAPLAQAVAARGKVPIFVGGTGFYFQALLHGLAPIPPAPPEVVAAVAARLDAEGLDALRADLMKIDPEYAAKIRPGDRNRALRALSVYEATGKSFSWWHAHAPAVPVCRGPLFVARVPMPELEIRLRRRLRLMLEKGALEEVERAAREIPDATAPAWSGIGARELAEYLAGAASLDECLEKWFANTRAYAKRQNTWFRGRAESVWFDPSEARNLLDSPLLAPFLSD